MFKTLISTVVIGAVAICAHAATRPNNFHVERSTDVNAPPEKIFALINDLHKWNDWTPYDKDPAMKKTYSGNASGKGAAYAWSGNREVGEGEIAITESSPSSRIAFDLHMIKPFEAHDHVVFALDAKGDTTTVNWIMEGRQPFLAKVMSVFVSMDKMVGKDFETGLARLKALAEK
ncbi:MAG: SRPBCC family protein [Sideroxyarcus sp.]|nr:SRPBCC family protein [Sideroxyarcus sp.]